jgi:xylulose-5-phosphate/fructose-6-phosphate phosphoketolase
LEELLRSYNPEELFDEHGRLLPELNALAPTGNRRMSADPVANGGLLRRRWICPMSRSLRGFDCGG